MDIAPETLVEGEVPYFGASDHASSQNVAQGDSSSAWVESAEEVDEAAHGLRASRSKKPIPVDRTLELRNRDLIEISTNYVQNMMAAERDRIVRKIPHQARKNAYHWILGVGLNGIGVSTYGQTYPLHGFAGATLYEMIGQTLPSVPDRKRSLDLEDVDGEVTRNVRPRIDEDENLVRHLDDAIEGDVAYIEAAREAGRELTDVSSTMPWNTASYRGSSVARGGSVLHAPSSASRVLGSLGRSNIPTRILSMSPIPVGSFSRRSTAEDGFQLIRDDGYADSVRVASNMTQQQHSWENMDGSQSLDTEPLNFLAFVQASIENKQPDTGQLAAKLGANSAASAIDFEELLHPADNTITVAAQAFHHVLTLVTWGALIVEQVDHFGRLTIQIP